MEHRHPTAKGRGSQWNPPNRFGGPEHVLDLSEVEHDQDFLDSLRHPRTQYLPDQARTIVAENDSPDISFRYSMNPYRGCSHGCSYCYARQTHEYLSYNAGLDFETKILVKHDAPALFRAFLMRPAWRPEPIALSGNTDCYQPAERTYRLTRGLLEVAAEFRQPISIITKNALILRDLNILGPMARLGLVHVNISITSLDTALVRSMEPRHEHTRGASAGDPRLERHRSARPRSGRAHHPRPERARAGPDSGRREGGRPGTPPTRCCGSP